MTPSRQDLTFLERCTAVSIQCHSLSFTKKLPKSSVSQTGDTPDGQDIIGIQVDSKTEAKRVSGSKKLLDCDEAEAIRKEFTRVKGFVKDRSLPTPFGEGIYFIPNTLLAEIDAELMVSQGATIPGLVRSLVAVYDDVLQREATALGPNFNPGDYDSTSEVQNRVSLDYSYVTFGIPQNLPEQIRIREVEKQSQRLTESVDAMQALLRNEMAKLVEHAVEKLTGSKEDGKPKVFRNSLIGNLRDFIQLFRDRNVTNDEQMEALCNKAKQLLDGVDPADLRDKEPVRESVARGFAEIKEALDGMLVPRGSRVIVLDDTPDEPEAETITSAA